ncbi:hypothetical protein CRYUN_Cryun33cG0051000 [Craigia yunnanensis]
MISSVRLNVLPVIVLFFALLQLSYGQSMGSSAPAPSNNGTAIDQGIAYTLLLVALAITYLIH